MKSREWDIRGWKKKTNPSGEVIRSKTYNRILPLWDNSRIAVINERDILARILGINKRDLYCNLNITIECERYRRNGRLLKRLKGVMATSCQPSGRLTELC